MSKAPTLEMLASSTDEVARALAARLAQSVQAGPGTCELWTGGMTGAGQPVVRVEGRQVALPRLVWLLLSRPGEGSRGRVYRVCGNQRCIAFEHLRDGRSRTPKQLDLMFTSIVPTQGGCMRWERRRNRRGYGVVHVDGAPQLAHRWWWERNRGALPEHVVLAHTCASPECVNLDHLVMTSSRGSAALTAARRGFPHGENHWNHKVTQEDVTAIRASSESLTTLAGRHHLSDSEIANIKAGRTWKLD